MDEYNERNKVTVVTNPNQTILINDRTYKSNENGIIEFYVNDICVGRDASALEFDRVLSTKLSEQQQRKLYEHFINSNIYIVRDIANVTKLEKNDIKEILDLGLHHNLLCRTFNSAWKLISKDKRDEIKGLLSRLNKESSEEKQPQTMKEILKQSFNEIDEIKTMNKMSEMNNEETTDVIAEPLKKNPPNKKPLESSSHMNRKPTKKHR